jgi:hypothetical protein
MSTPVFERDLTAFMVVDPHNDFISEGRSLCPLVKEIAEAVPCVPNMLRFFRLLVLACSPTPVISRVGCY